MRGVREKPKKRKPPGEPENKTQYERFVRDAKALEVDETGEAYARAMGVIAAPKKPPKTT